MLLYLLIPSPWGTFNFSPTGTGTIFGMLKNEKKFFDLYQLPEDYYLTKEDFRSLDSFIPANKGQVMIFPYDNYILNIYRNNINATIAIYTTTQVL